jgi:Flp pilus assembly protein TadB
MPADPLSFITSLVLLLVALVEFYWHWEERQDRRVHRTERRPAKSKRAQAKKAQPKRSGKKRRRR